MFGRDCLFGDIDGSTDKRDLDVNDMRDKFYYRSNEGSFMAVMACIEDQEKTHCTDCHRGLKLNDLRRAYIDVMEQAIDEALFGVEFVRYK